MLHDYWRHPDPFSQGDPCPDEEDREALDSAYRLMAVNDFKGARKVIRKSLQFREETYGRAHPAAAYARTFLGEMLVYAEKALME